MAAASPLESMTIAMLISPGSPPEYYKLAKQEITALLGERFNLAFELHEVTGSDPKAVRTTISKLMQDNSTSCLLGLSLGISDALIRHKKYAKPVIAAAILDPNLQGLRTTKAGTSGIDNFNYIQSPFNVEKDLATFKKLIDFKKLAILYRGDDDSMFHNIYNFLGRSVARVSPDAKVSIIDAGNRSAQESIELLDNDVDAVYLALTPTEDSAGHQYELIRLLNARKLPTFSLTGEKSVQAGALASIAPERNMKAISRRIAINLLNISQGQNAADQQVGIGEYTDNFVVNVGTMRLIGHYPSWDALEDARLTNLVGAEPGRNVTLRSVILEALQANLELQIAKVDTRLQQQEIGIARSALLPQVVLGTSFTSIDDNRANGKVNNPAPHTWSATGTLSQTIFSDDILANYEIQNILLESQQFQEKTQLLDTVVTAAEAYIQLLFARSNQVIINTNLAVTRKNLDIAHSKAAVGSVGASDVYRWESELAQNQIELNDGYRDLQLAKLNLNQILNRPVDEPFKAEEIQPVGAIELMITDPEVYKYIEDFDKLSRFSNFLVKESDRNLPELHQIEAVIRSQQRAVKNSKRAFFLPDFQLSGQFDKIIDEYDTDFSTPSDMDHPWTVTATASWPLYEGSNRQYDLSRKRLEVRKSRLQSINLRNQLHLQVRSALETAAVSAREVELSSAAMEAARKNFEIVQAGYSEGKSSIAELIDAQNAKTSSEQGQAIARYQFVLDFLELERSTGRFHFLEEPLEKAGFISRLQEYMALSTDSSDN